MRVNLTKISYISKRKKRKINSTHFHLYIVFKDNRKSAPSFFLNNILVFHSLNRISSKWTHISKGFVKNEIYTGIVEKEKSLENVVQLESGEIRLKINSSESTLNESSVVKKCDEIKKDYMAMINDVHILLQNYEKLSNEEKLEYCNSERYFMKMYLRHALIKINKCFPE